MRFYRKRISAAATLMLSILAVPSVYATEQSQEYQLDPVVVTAQRYENTELNFKAASAVWTPPLRYVVLYADTLDQ